MEENLQNLLRALSHMRRRNAIIIGSSGTGKSALVYSLARKLFKRDDSLPDWLRDCDIFELTPSFFRAGAGVVGEYENRIKSLLAVLSAHPQILLFVDEIHSFFQSGLHGRGAFSEANESFKGALARGEITCIGCTTLEEYRALIEPDKALVRRFTVVRLEQPSRDATVEILRQRRPKFEEHFSPLRIPDAILARIVDLSDEYLRNRFQPDKALLLLDDACAAGPRNSRGSSN